MKIQQALELKSVFIKDDKIIITCYSGKAEEFIEILSYPWLINYRLCFAYNLGVPLKNGVIPKADLS